jgi:hypothetical protein
MPRKKSGFKFMIEFVQEYLDGENERLFFDLDFIHYLREHYPKMEREDSELADCFSFYLAEQGFNKSKGLSDEEHKELIREQFEEFNAAMRDGLY